MASTGRGHEGALRILVVIPGAPEGSSMVFCRRLVAAMQAEVTIESFYIGPGRSVVSFLTDLLSCYRQIARFQPQIIHAQYGTKTGLFCTLLNRRPMIVTFRGSDINPTPSRARMVSFMKRLVSQVAGLRADAVICVSQEIRDRLWWCKDRAIVLPTGVDTDVFYPRDRNECRATLGWQQSARIILFYAGRNPAVKRLDLAEAAVNLLRKSGTTVDFQVMRGEIDPDLVPILMNAADCFLLTSDYEGSPTVVQEAKACNLPVVSVDVGDVATQLHGTRGNAIVERDPRSIADAIAQVLERGTRSDGVDHLDGVSLTSVGSLTVAVYRRLLSSRNRR